MQLRLKNALHASAADGWECDLPTFFSIATCGDVMTKVYTESDYIATKLEATQCALGSLLAWFVEHDRMSFDEACDILGLGYEDRPDVIGYAYH